MIINMTCTPENVHLYIGIYIYIYIYTPHFIFTFLGFPFHPRGLIPCLGQSPTKRTWQWKVWSTEARFTSFLHVFYYHILGGKNIHTIPYDFPFKQLEARGVSILVMDH